MSVVDTLKSIVGLDDGGVMDYQYRCVECGNEFESGKDPERVQCMECMGTDVEVLDRQ